MIGEMTKPLSSLTWLSRKPFPYGTPALRRRARKKVVQRVGEFEWSVRGKELHRVEQTEPDTYRCDCRDSLKAKHGRCAHILAVLMFQGIIE